jgi:hypothetical protein
VSAIANLTSVPVQLPIVFGKRKEKKRKEKKSPLAPNFILGHACMKP